LDDYFKAEKHCKKLIEKLEEEHGLEAHKAPKESEMNTLVGECLAKALDDENAFESEYKIDGLFKSDFYVPSARLNIEVNGMQHFYPYTTKFNQMTNFKYKTLKD